MSLRDVTWQGMARVWVHVRQSLFSSLLGANAINTFIIILIIRKRRRGDRQLQIYNESKIVRNTATRLHVPSMLTSAATMASSVQSSLLFFVFLLLNLNHSFFHFRCNKLLQILSFPHFIYQNVCNSQLLPVCYIYI